jgi:hypothetical protein
MPGPPPSPLRLNLVRHCPALRKLPPGPTAKETQAIWADRLPLLLPSKALPELHGQLLCLPERADPNLPYGPGRRPEEQRLLLRYLLDKAEAQESFTFNALWWEKRGGRRYPFLIPGYQGKLTITRHAYEALKHKHLLAATPRDVRAFLEVRDGWVLLHGDFACCQMALAQSLAPDPQLARDLRGDIHQVVGDLFAGQRGTPKLRRTFGKLLNYTMMFGGTAQSVQEAARKALGCSMPEDEAQQILRAWWDRYPKLRGFRKQVDANVDKARNEDRSFVVVSPSGRRSTFYPAQVKGHRYKPTVKEKGPKGAKRSIFSAILRAVEGDLMDRMLHHWHAGRDAHGGRLALPLYDGIIFGAREGRKDETWAAMERAAARAAKELGVRTRLVRE